MRTMTIALLATLALGCSNVMRMPPILVGRAPDAPSMAALQRVIGAVRAQGYEPNPVQPEMGRFAIMARYTDGLGRYTITVECFGDGHVLLSPRGPRVRRHADYYDLPRPLRDEILDIARGLEAPVQRPG